MEGSSQNEEVVKDQPYFTDGNIVLSALSSQHKNTRLFRVHTFMLSHHSPIFAGMLSLPPQPSVNEMYENVPVVRLTDDADDLRDFLKALYDSGSLPLHDHRGDLAEDLIGALRLATKYQVDTMRGAIIKRLEGEWPHGLIEWLAFMAKYKRIRETLEMEMLDERKRESLPEPVTAINVALEFGIPSILPAAFYLLSLANIQREWRARKGWSCESSWGCPVARWSRLKGTDFVRLLRGKSELFTKTYRTWEHVRKDCYSCEQEPSCQEIIIRNHGGPALVERFGTASYRVCPDIFTAILAMVDEANDMVICINCRYLYQLALQNHMMRIWDQLPSTFELPRTSDEI